MTIDVINVMIFSGSRKKEGLKMGENKWIDIKEERPPKEHDVFEIRGSFGQCKMSSMPSMGGFLVLNPAVKSWDDITHWRKV